jgi:subtilase family serine protease/uncharacterized protein (UPF0333 family)
VARRRAQASSEFLIIFAAVALIAVIVAALFMQSSGTNYESRHYQSEVYWNNEKPIAITEAKAIKNGLILVVKNTGREKLSLKRISVKEELVSIANSTNASIALDPGMSAKFTVDASYGDIGNRKFVAFDMKFDFVSLTGKTLIGKDKLILPAPGACNIFGEACFSNLDCCNSVPCKFGTCGGCGEDGQNCTSDSDCCEGLYCYDPGPKGKCRQKPDLVPILATTQPMDPFSNATFAISNIGAGPAMLSRANVSWRGLGCTAPACESTWAANIGILDPSHSQEFTPPFACLNATNIQVIADSLNTVPESDETNNEFFPILSCPIADLVADTAPENMSVSHAVGVPFGVRIFTSNIGSADAASSTTRAAFGGGTVDGAPYGEHYYSLIPASSADGGYYVMLNCAAEGAFDFTLIADYYNNVTESNESNMRIYGINCAMPFDLEILLNGSIPPEVPVGTFSTAYTIVRNNGPGSSPALNDLNANCAGAPDPSVWPNGNPLILDPISGIYIPGQPYAWASREISTGDVANGGRTGTPSLASGANVTSSYSLDCRFATAGGTVEAFVGINSCHDFLETTYSNNYIFANTTCCGGAGAICPGSGCCSGLVCNAGLCGGLSDLITNGSVTALSPPKIVGVPFTVPITITNNGSYGTSRGYVSVNYSFSRGTSNPVSANSAGSLAAGASRSLSVTLNCTSAGASNFTINVDYDNGEPESIENNNAWSYITTCVNMPDLVAFMPSPPVSLTVGVPATFTVRTNNTGTAPSVNVSITRVYAVSLGFTVNGSSTANITVPNIAPGILFDSQIVINCTIPVNSRIIRVIADNRTNVSESNEINNMNSYTFNCVAGTPDLVANTTPMLLPASVPTGVPFTINVTTYNIGVAGSNPSNTSAQLYMCNAVSNASFADVPSLASGNNNRSEVTLVCSFPGQNTLGIRADARNTNAEGAGEGNNLWEYNYVNCVGSPPPGYLPDLVHVYHGINANYFTTVLVSLPAFGHIAMYNVSGFQWNMHVGNAGNVTSTATQTNISATPYGGLLFSGQALYADPTPPLTPCQLDIFFPSMVCNGSGIRTFDMIVDAVSAVTESNENNNNWTSMRFNCTLADVVPAWQGTPPSSTQYVGVPFTVNINISNIGGISTGPNVNKPTTTNVSYGYVSGPPFQLVSLPIPGLGVRGASGITPPYSAVSSTTLSCPPAFSPGLTRIRITADANSEIPELSESNTITRDINCYARADLTATADTAPLAVPHNVGVDFPITITTRNTGAAVWANATPSTTRVRLGTNSYDIPVGDIIIGSAIDSIIYVACPSAGSLQFNVTADAPPGAVPESIETNNVWVYPGTVTCTP